MTVTDALIADIKSVGERLDAALARAAAAEEQVVRLKEYALQEAYKWEGHHARNKRMGNEWEAAMSYGYTQAYISIVNKIAAMLEKEPTP